MDVVLAAFLLFAFIYLCVEGLNREATSNLSPKPTLANPGQTTLLWTLKATESIYIPSAKSARCSGTPN